MQLGLPLEPPETVAPSPGPAEAGHYVREAGPAEAGHYVPEAGHYVPVEFLFVRNRRARRYLVRVDHDGGVRVTIPRGGSRREADAFASRHLEWIQRERSRIAATPRVLLYEEERRLRRGQANRELPGQLLRLAAAHGLAVARVSIRNQRSRWGSCGRDGHICLNWRLVLMPQWVREYVMLHELMHLRRMDHSPAYWRLVAAACPDYQKARRWLREHGASLR